MPNPITLDIAVTTDPTNAARGFASVGDTAADMGVKLDRAGADATTAATKLDRAGSAAESLDDKGSRATGAMGALASGLSLMGPQGEAAAAALETAALATDGLSGAGQALKLVLEAEKLATIRARIATIAKTASEKAAAVASKALRVATLLLNAAFVASPIGLVVVTVLALVAAFVLVYRHSKTVREGVATLGDKAREVFDKLLAAATKVKDGLGAAFDAVLGPIQAVIDKVQDLIGWLGRIKLPDVGGIVDSVVPGRAATGVGSRVVGLTGPAGLGTNSGTNTRARAGGVVQYITINGALDPVAVANQIDALRRNQSRLTGVAR